MLAHSRQPRGSLAAARARGVQLGRPPQVSPQTLQLILELRRRRWTPTAIATHLEDQGISAPRGGSRWHTATVAGIIRRAGGRLKRGRPAKRRPPQKLYPSQ